jgi:putative oxidoreductase
MAVAYFTAWAPRGFWPINNGGEEAALFCWIFLWLFTAGAGPWSLDGLLHRAAKPTKQAIDAWEGYGRSLLRLVVAFMFSLHGYRHLFGVFPRVAGRRGAVPMALDALPSVCGVLEIAGGLLLLIGLFTRPTALVLCCELLVAYFYSALPRAIWPVRNGGDEVLLYLLVFLYLATSGAGAWSWDDFLKKDRTGLVTANAVRTT